MICAVSLGTVSSGTLNSIIPYHTGKTFYRLALRPLTGPKRILYCTIPYRVAVSGWEPPILGNAGATLPCDGGRGRPPKTSFSPYMLARRINLVVLRQRVYAQVEENPQIGEHWGSVPLERGPGWPPKNKSLPISVTRSNLVVLYQNV